MAYTKKSKAYRSRGGSSYRSKSVAKRSNRSTGRKPAGRSVQTLRIVVEQPSVTSSVAGIVPANQNSPRKAAF